MQAGTANALDIKDATNSYLELTTHNTIGNSLLKLAAPVEITSGVLTLDDVATDIVLKNTEAAALEVKNVAGTTYMTFDTANAQVQIDVATDASSSTDGALAVTGGLSIAKKSYLNNDVSINGDLTFLAAKDIILQAGTANALDIKDDTNTYLSLTTHNTLTSSVLTLAAPLSITTGTVTLSNGAKTFSLLDNSATSLVFQDSNSQVHLTVDTSTGAEKVIVESDLSVKGGDITGSTAAATTVDAGGNFALNLGTANAASVSVSKAGATTTVGGALTVTEDFTMSAFQVHSTKADYDLSAGNTAATKTLNFVATASGTNALRLTPTNGRVYTVCNTHNIDVRVETSTGSIYQAGIIATPALVEEKMCQSFACDGTNCYTVGQSAEAKARRRLRSRTAEEEEEDTSSSGGTEARNEEKKLADQQKQIEAQNARLEEQEARLEAQSAELAALKDMILKVAQ